MNKRVRIHIIVVQNVEEIRIYWRTPDLKPQAVTRSSFQIIFLWETPTLYFKGPLATLDQHKLHSERLIPSTMSGYKGLV